MPGESKVILGWYSHPPEEQITREVGVASLKNFEIWSPNQCFSLIHGVAGAKSGTVNTVVTVPCPTLLHAQDTRYSPLASTDSTSAVRTPSAWLP